MNINISLSTESILSAIHRLEEAKENLGAGLQQTIDILAKEGAIVAQMDDGSMASVEAVSDSETQSRIVASGGDTAIIAEFGAGDATLNPGDFFEDGGALSGDVFPGSYSLFKGSRDYYNFHSWRFGGRWYTEVAPRHGLFDAKLFIMANSADIAKEVIKL